MLLLTRGIGQKIYIGDDITIVVSAIRQGQVRIGIEAPKDVQIQRDDAICKVEKNKDLE